MAKLLMLSGLPASGKSTKSKEIVDQGGWCRVNRDLLRPMLHWGKFSGKNEKMTVEMEKAIAAHLLLKRTNVVVDDTNLNPKNKEMWQKLAIDLECKFERLFIDTPIEECIERDSKREGDKKVGPTVIKKMAMQYLGYLKGEKVIICDLDGTLCNVDHRLHFVKGEKKDWRGFFVGIAGDTIRGDVVEKLAPYFQANSDIKLILVSARPEDYRAVTEKWLDENYPWSDYEMLIMRESYDGRKDTEVKSDIYDKYLKDLEIVKIFDDRPSVIRMWKEKGLEVEDVGSGVEF